MKKIFLSVLIIFCAFFQLQAQEETAWKTNTEAGISIKCPEDWTNQKGLMGTTIFVASPLESEKDGFSENVNLVVEDLQGMEIGIEEYAEFTKAQIEALITNSKILKAEKITFQEKDAYTMEYTGQQGQYKLHWKQIYFIKKGKAYILTYTAEGDKFAKYLPTADRIIQSFKY